MRIYTVGHSTQSIDEFVATVGACSVEQIVDIRSMPGSRRCPQFNAEAMAVSLPEAGLMYWHLPLLGGLRKHRNPDDLTNAAWRNASFRSYADYMSTGDFATGLGQLLDLGSQRPTAIMCAEAVWWRCHRSLVADALIASGVEVHHIYPGGRSSPHKLADHAVVHASGKVTYPEEHRDPVEV